MDSAKTLPTVHSLRDSKGPFHNAKPEIVLNQAGRLLYVVQSSSIDDQGDE